MKKLIVVLAVVACAVAAQAATVAWTVTNIYKGNTSDKAQTTDGYMVYLINDATYSQATAAAALAGGTLTTDILDSKKSASSGLTAAGKVSTDANVGDLANGTYNFYNVIVGGGNAVVGSNVTLEVTPVGNPQMDSFNAKTLTQSASNWKSVSGGSTPDVPEPTSALLLLMGGAMLALRRKRA